MPKTVYNIVEDYRVLDNGRIAEDVTKVGLSTISHPTNSIENVSGMVGDIDMPNSSHVSAMEISIAHNNGANCKYLSMPGKHNLEFRCARQRFDVADAEMRHESVKYRVVGIFKETEKGDLQKGNPLGSTEKFSVLRYEEEINGEIVTLIDIAAGILRVDGEDYTSEIEALLA